MTTLAVFGAAAFAAAAWLSAAWLFLSVTRFITQPACYSVRPRKKLNVWIVTDYLPWAAMRGCLRLVGKAPPDWLSWLVSYTSVLLLLVGLDHAVAAFGPSN